MKNPQQSWAYLDNNATTRPAGRVIEAMLPFYSDQFANASSMHGLGTESADAVRTARSQVRAFLGAERDSEILFTSGGSESNNTAIFSALDSQAGRNEIITSVVEHPAVLAVCAHLERIGRAKIHRIPVDRAGNLSLDAYRAALNQRTALVTMQWANNETGVIFPVELLASMAHGAGALFHCDAVQAAGRIALNIAQTEIDMLSLSAHKMHGPKGIGALYLRHGMRVTPLIHGGRQERGRRAGTENTPAIVGFGVAAEMAMLTMTQQMQRVAELRDCLKSELLQQIPGAMVIGDGLNMLPNTLNMAFADVEADEILLMLDKERIAASSGSACSAGSMEASHVLRAMKVPFSHLRGSIRFSLSRESTMDEINRVVTALPRIVEEVRSASMPLEVACD